MKKVLVFVITLIVLVFIARSARSSGYQCASTKDVMSVQAQGAQCYKCNGGSWQGGDCLMTGKTRGTVTVYDASSSIDNAMPGRQFWWSSDKPRPDPAYPPLWK
jgi:hypothetical protein